MRRMNVPVAHLGSMDYVPHLIARLCSSGNSACPAGNRQQVTGAQLRANPPHVGRGGQHVRTSMHCHMTKRYG